MKSEIVIFMLAACIVIAAVSAKITSQILETAATEQMVRSGKTK